MSGGEFEGALALLRKRFDRELVEQLDGDSFAANLLEYLRTRKTPRLPFSPERLPEIARLCAEHDPAEWAATIEEAEAAVAGRMGRINHPHGGAFVEIDRSTFDFSSYDHEDPQVIHRLNRQGWFRSLGRAYWHEQDPRYFEALMDHWDFYAAKVDAVGPEFYKRLHALGGKARLKTPYHELDNFIRLTSWWWAFWTTLHAKEMTPERCCVLLARCLRLFDLVAARGIRHHHHNFTAMQLEALYLWAGMLPEVMGMPVWQSNARNCAESSLGLAVYGDGVQWEKSTGYHGGCIWWYGVPCLMGRLWGDAWAPEYTERLLAMGRFLDALVTPDGGQVMLSDSGRTGKWQHALSCLVLFDREVKFRHAVGPSCLSLWLSDGRVWEAADTAGPQPRVEVFPQGGVAAVRDSEGPATTLLILDNGPTDAHHSHQDNLTLHYEALGRPILVDAGKAIYRQDDDRAWVMHAVSHNTVTLQDEPVVFGEPLPQASNFLRLRQGDPRIGPIRQEERDGYVLLDTSFSGFAGDASAQVRRLVAVSTNADKPWLAVADRMTADTPHTWTSTWLLPAQTPLEKDGAGLRAVLAGGLHPAIACAATDAPLELTDEAMFWSPQYGTNEPARWLRFAAKSTEAARAFVFIACETPAAPPAVSFIDGGASLRFGTRTLPLSLDASVQQP